MNMGEKILNLRKARGWNQEELAERIGVTRQAVSRWESNSAKPDADKIIAICDLFGISADYLLRESYSGEGNGTLQETRIIQKSIGIKAKQIFGFFSFALGLIMLIGLEILCVIYPHTLHTDTKIYHGLSAYVRVYDLEWIIWVLWALMAGGVLLLLWDWMSGIIMKNRKGNSV